MKKVIIIGGGAAGMLASIFTARMGHEVHIYEQNDRLGRKLFITGKGRCNITNACEVEELLSAIVSNSKFLYSSLYGYSNCDIVDLLEELGVTTKVERGNRVFPVSDKSNDVIRALEHEMKRQKVQIHLKQAVKSVKEEQGVFSHIILENGKHVVADSCIVATGGCSYPLTGSKGKGYQWGEELGHTIMPLFPSLVPMEVREDEAKELQGLSLRNVNVTILRRQKNKNTEVYTNFGEMLFTHYGVSGPLIIDASAYVGPMLQTEELQLQIDLKPALSIQELDRRILREFDSNQNKQFKNVIGSLFPAKLLPVMLKRGDILPEKPVNLISKEERLAFVKLVKTLTFTITKLRGFEEAIITKGGICVKEINPSTMESKKVKNLYFIGEILDLDALTGGYNLQIAWSSAYAAAMSQ